MVNLRPVPADVVIALVFAVLAPLEIWVDDVSGPPEAKLAYSLLCTLPLAWRTVAPVAATMVTTGGLALAIALGMPADEGSFVAVVAPLVAVYSVGAHASVRATVIAVGFVMTAMAAGLAIGNDPVGELAIYGLAVAIALLVGRAVRAMGFEVDVLEARADELERERDLRTQAAVAAERSRIARELHDVIGHSISVMGVQAGAVRRRLTPEQEREREVLLAVEKTGRDAVGEMQRLLGILRSNGAEPPLDAIPTVQRVDDLVADLRRAGLEVGLRVEGDLDDLPPGRGVAAFRILQEALTNALKHAPGARVEALLRRAGPELVIEVVDTGGARAAERSDGGGHGIVGMRERVALYGGSLDAGPEGSGFAVRARIPVTGS
jgi:signal transduction histidine kinase